MHKAQLRQASCRSGKNREIGICRVPPLAMPHDDYRQSRCEFARGGSPTNSNF